MLEASAATGKDVQFSPGVENKRRMLFSCKKHILLKGMKSHGRENGVPHYIALIGQIMHVVLRS